MEFWECYITDNVIKCGNVYVGIFPYFIDKCLGISSVSPDFEILACSRKWIRNHDVQSGISPYYLPHPVFSNKVIYFKFIDFYIYNYKVTYYFNLVPVLFYDLPNVKTAAQCVSAKNAT